jgi:nucleotide-binding universal stress UspA family protein
MRILVATDGSQHAMRAAAMALRLVRELKQADVVVINVGHIPEIALAASGVPGEAVDLGGLIESLDQAGQRILDQTAEMFTGGDIEVRRDYRTGAPAAEIVGAAREHKADLIVMGSRGLGQIGGLVLGSVSERVLHLAHGPVLIVR